MKKLFLLFALSIFFGCLSPAFAGITIGSVSDFTQIAIVNNQVKTTSPLGLGYAIDFSLSDSVSISGLTIYAPKLFVAAGISHVFDSSNVVVNYIPIIAGIAFQPAKGVPLDIGVGAGVNAVNGKFIAGINTEYEITPIVTGLTAAARLITHKPKVKGNLKISIF